MTCLTPETRKAWEKYVFKWGWFGGKTVTYSDEGGWYCGRMRVPLPIAHSCQIYDRVAVAPEQSIQEIQEALQQDSWVTSMGLSTPHPVAQEVYALARENPETAIICQKMLSSLARKYHFECLHETVPGGWNNRLQREKWLKEITQSCKSQPENVILERIKCFLEDSLEEGSRWKERLLCTQATLTKWTLRPTVVGDYCLNIQCQKLMESLERETSASAVPITVLTGSNAAIIVRQYLKQIPCTCLTWTLDASSKETLEQGYHELAKRLSLSRETIIPYLEENRDWLLLFENANHLEILKGQLPRRGGKILGFTTHPYGTTNDDIKTLPTTIFLDPATLLPFSQHLQLWFPAGKHRHLNHTDSTICKLANQLFKTHPHTKKYVWPKSDSPVEANLLNFFSSIEQAGMELQNMPYLLHYLGQRSDATELWNKNKKESIGQICDQIALKIKRTVCPNTPEISLGDLFLSLARHAISSSYKTQRYQHDRYDGIRHGIKDKINLQKWQESRALLNAALHYFSRENDCLKQFVTYVLLASVCPQKRRTYYEAALENFVLSRKDGATNKQFSHKYTMAAALRVKHELAKETPSCIHAPSVGIQSHVVKKQVVERTPADIEQAKIHNANSLLFSLLPPEMLDMIIGWSVDGKTQLPKISKRFCEQTYRNPQWRQFIFKKTKEPKRFLAELNQAIRMEDANSFSTYVYRLEQLHAERRSTFLMYNSQYHSSLFHTALKYHNFTAFKKLLEVLNQTIPYCSDKTKTAWQKILIGENATLSDTIDLFHLEKDSLLSFALKHDVADESVELLFDTIRKLRPNEQLTLTYHWKE